MTRRIDDGRGAALHRAARALAEQDGTGIARELIVDLVTAGAAITMHAQGGHVIAFVEPAPGADERFAPLSPRERQVAALLADGRSNTEIADALVITVGTVKDHVHSVLDKTGLRSRAAVAAAWHGAAQSA
jgi:DNA-binding NarL/FixJ family response regulator